MLFPVTQLLATKLQIFQLEILDPRENYAAFTWTLNSS